MGGFLLMSRDHHLYGLSVQFIYLFFYLHIYFLLPIAMMSGGKI